MEPREPTTLLSGFPASARQRRWAIVVSLLLVHLVVTCHSLKRVPGVAQRSVLLIGVSIAICARKHRVQR